MLRRCSFIACLLPVLSIPGILMQSAGQVFARAQKPRSSACDGARNETSVFPFPSAPLPRTSLLLPILGAFSAVEGAGCSTLPLPISSHSVAPCIGRDHPHFTH